MTTYTGQSIRRFEDHRLLTGQSSFVDDMTRTGLLHALMIRSPHGHARIRSIDVSAALALPGVAAVVTAQDMADIAQLPTRESADADEMHPPRHPALAVDKACYAGQPVAIVLADNIYTAQDAVDLVNIDYEILPAVIDPLTATSDSTPCDSRASRDQPGAAHRQRRRRPRRGLRLGGLRHPPAVRRAAACPRANGAEGTARGIRRG